MAYKFQLGEAQMSGSLIQSGSFAVSANDGDEVFSVSQLGSIDCDGNIDADGDLTVATITMAEFGVDASGNTDVDGTLNVQGVPTFQAAAVFSSGITTAGNIGGGGTLALTGLASVASISMDDGSTLGPDSVAGLWTFSAAGDTTQADGAYDFNLASHDGTNGLKLNGVLVNASAADLNFTNVAAVGTAEASKCLVVDASRDIDNINDLGITSMANNWTNAGRTVADLGSITTVDINGGSVDNATIGATVQSSGKFTTVSGSGAVSVGGALNMENIATANWVSASAGFAFMDGASITQRTYAVAHFISDIAPIDAALNQGITHLSNGDGIKLMLDFDGLSPVGIDVAADSLAFLDATDSSTQASTIALLATAMAGDGIKATSGVLSYDASELTPATVNVAADSLIFLDADGSVTVRDTFVDYATAIAGSGLTATDGVLSSDASPTPTDHDDDSGNLLQGFNWSSAVFTAARTWTLPTNGNADVGDVVTVKAPANADVYRLTIAKNGDQTIDGEASLFLDSPFAAIDLVFAAANTWLIK